MSWQVKSLPSPAQQHSPECASDGISSWLFQRASEKPRTPSAPLDPNQLLGYLMKLGGNQPCDSPKVTHLAHHEIQSPWAILHPLNLGPTPQSLGPLQRGLFRVNSLRQKETKEDKETGCEEGGPRPDPCPPPSLPPPHTAQQGWRYRRVREKGSAASFPAT